MNIGFPRMALVGCTLAIAGLRSSAPRGDAIGSLGSVGDEITRFHAGDRRRYGVEGKSP